MHRLTLVAAGALVAAASLGAPWSPVFARSTSLAPKWPCALGFAATAVPGDPYAAIVRLNYGPLLPGGTVTAYGVGTRWSGTVDRFASVKHNDTTEYSFIVRADAPIEAVAYEPPKLGCVSRAGVRARDGYDGADVERPATVVADAQPLEPISCTRRYAAPATLQAAEPVMPPAAIEHGISGTVSVAVTLDDRGRPMSAAVVHSPSPFVNEPSIAAAMQSDFSPAIFRCITVPSVYIFSVGYVP
ncbi:MAG TPA: energy transducer TonB [Candidatus Elarobacter sp.]|nr:energy transducer TonB [Candidatus Elarobacter sp.]